MCCEHYFPSSLMIHSNCNPFLYVLSPRQKSCLLNPYWFFLTSMVEAFEHSRRLNFVFVVLNIMTLLTESSYYPFNFQ